MLFVLLSDSPFCVSLGVVVMEITEKSEGEGGVGVRGRGVGVQR